MENKDFGFIQNVKFVDVLLGQGFVGAMHTPKATRKDMAHQLTLRRVLPRVLPPSPPHPAPSLPSPAPSPRVLRRVSPRLTLHASGYPAGPAAIIRDISFRIQPEMTPFGYSILMLG